LVELTNVNTHCTEESVIYHIDLMKADSQNGAGVYRWADLMSYFKGAPTITQNKL
jgi:hypothetical protein